MLCKKVHLNDIAKPVSAATLYIVMAAIAFRFGLGGTPSAFPQGTNALDSFLTWNYQSSHPLSTWLYPLTDWGQPTPGFTGVTLLTPAIITVGTTQLIRAIEFLAYAGAGFSLYAVVRRLGRAWFAAVPAGAYYMLMVQTPEYFEGHVPAMISLAIAPLFLYSVGILFLGPKLSRASVTAFLLYVLASIGDLGILYMLLFFAIPIAIVALLKSNAERRYSRAQWASLGFGFAIFGVLSLSWSVPFALGARPMYTTNITSATVPFSQVAGEQIIQAFVGFIHDNSFTLYYLGSPTYSYPGTLAQALAIVLPVLVALYVLVQHKPLILLFYLSGTLSMCFATGALYPFSSSINSAFYNNVPFFNYLPEMFRWNAYTVFVYAVLLAYMLTWAENILRGVITSQSAATPAARSSAPSDGRAETPWTSPGLRSRWRNGTFHLSRDQRNSLALKACAMVVVIGLASLQNWEAFSEPPELFSFPPAYTAGFSFVEAHPVTGSILTLPFGAIYERTPWGGVSQSSLLMAPYFSGADTAIFQAGTTSSLAIDRVLGGGLTYGYSNNMTKLLSALNVQSIVTTHYPNWNEVSDSLYNPIVSYYAIQNQTGLGTPAFAGSLQTVYDVGPDAGNVSFHSSYYTYYGNRSLVYLILNEPWDQGASNVLVDGTNLTASEQAEFVEHSGAIVALGSNATRIPASVVSHAIEFGVPLNLEFGANEVVPNTAVTQTDLWNSSNGIVFHAINESTPIAISLPGFASLPGVGGNATVIARVSSPPGALIGLEASNRTFSVSVGSPTVNAAENLSNTSGIQAGINNQGRYPYNGSIRAVEIEPGNWALDWRFSPENSTFQYLNFENWPIRALGGLEVRFASGTATPAQMDMTVYFGKTGLTIPGYKALAGNESAFVFYFPSLGATLETELQSNLTNISRFVVGMPSSGSFSSLTITGLDWINISNQGFRFVNLAELPISDLGFVRLSAAPACFFDSVSVTIGGGDGASAVSQFAPDFSRQSSSTSLTATFNDSGWGLILLAQTYSPLWTISGVPAVAHVSANIGLNAWLVNLSKGLHSVTLTYQGQTWMVESYLVEGIALAVLIVTAAYWVIRRERRRRTDEPQPRSPISGPETSAKIDSRVASERSGRA